MLSLDQYIADVSREVYSASLKEKKDIKSEEEIINTFLDALLDFKSNLDSKTKKIIQLSDDFEKLSWIEFDPQKHSNELFAINNLIASARELHRSFIRQYISFTFFRQKGIAKNEIKVFKAALDQFKEIVTDIESVFFFLPEMVEFKETTKKIISL